MRLHTDTLLRADLGSALPPAVDLHVVTRHGSRSRDHAFEVQLRGYGVRHTRRPNSGQYGAGDEYAATYTDWGRWLSTLFEQDPNAVAGHYKGAADFDRQTAGLYAPHADGSLLVDAIVAFVRDRLAFTPGSTKTAAYIEAEQRFEVGRWIIERACFGEL